MLHLVDDDLHPNQSDQALVLVQATGLGEMCGIFVELCRPAKPIGSLEDVCRPVPGISVSSREALECQ